MPSDGGGDWAIARSAAVHVSGVERVTVEGCLFERLDGNAVMISGAPPKTPLAPPAPCIIYSLPTLPCPSPHSAVSEYS